MGPDSALTPDLIQSQAFTSGFRGYEQGEVRAFLTRVAAELRGWQERAEQLESAWHSAEERAARPPVLDEETLMAAVGEETASILRSARAAATDMRAKAAEESERTVAEARAEAERRQAEAAVAVERATAAAQEAAAKIKAASEAEAAEVVERARTDADAIRAQADKDRALTIEGANATRDRILDDLSRRRRVASVQIEQLRAGRERLIESYAVVRRTLEEASSELSRADAEARAAADDVGRRMRAEEETQDDPHSSVDELFARIRGTSVPAPAGEDAAAVAPGPEDAEPDGPGPEEAAPEGAEPADGDAVEPDPVDDGREPRSDADESLLQLRETALLDLEVTLSRRLKRALQDEQNDVLDRLRGVKGDPEPASLLGDEGAQTARYRDAARPQLEAAALAGAGFAARVTGSTPPAVEVGIDDLAAEAGSSLGASLRRRLEDAVLRKRGEDQSALVESLGAAYREWKTQRVERLAGDLLATAFSRGVWESVPDGASLRWLVDDLDGPCPDCDDDALAGELPKGESFPTGQHYPPAHSGCRCLLVPVAAVAASVPR